MSGIATTDCTKAGDGDLRGIEQSRSYAYAYAYWDSAELSGVTSRAVSQGEEFAQVAVRVCAIEKALLGQHLWARGYWVATSSNVTDEVWKEYIKQQTPPEPDDEFCVVWRQQSAAWPIDPAFSRNQKPPTLADGVFTFSGNLTISVSRAMDTKAPTVPH
jgi:hypothetical protein